MIANYESGRKKTLDIGEHSFSPPHCAHRP